MKYKKNGSGYAPYNEVEGEPVDSAEKGKEPAVEKFSVAVTDDDRKLAAKDNFTSRVFGKRAAEIYAHQLRPSVGPDNKVMYMPISENFKLPDGKRIGLRYNADNNFDVVMVGPDGTSQPLDDKSSGEFRGLSSDAAIEYLNSIYTKRYNNITASR